MAKTQKADSSLWAEFRKSLRGAARNAVTEFPFDVQYPVSSVIRYAIATATVVLVLRWMGVLTSAPVSIR